MYIENAAWSVLISTTRKTRREYLHLFRAHRNIFEHFPSAFGGAHRHRESSNHLNHRLYGHYHL